MHPVTTTLYVSTYDYETSSKTATLSGRVTAMGSPASKPQQQMQIHQMTKILPGMLVAGSTSWARSPVDINDNSYLSRASTVS